MSLHREVRGAEERLWTGRQRVALEGFVEFLLTQGLLRKQSTRFPGLRLAGAGISFSASVGTPRFSSGGFLGPA